MDLWIRSTAKTNLLRARFLTIMKGSTFYKKSEWEYDCYTICNVADNGNYEILGTYKTKKRALDILDEIQDELLGANFMPIEKDEEVVLTCGSARIYEMPEE